MRIALIATHHAEYSANLALSLAARHDVLLVLSARNARFQLSDQALATLRAGLRLQIVPHHYAPVQHLVGRLCHRAVVRFGADLVHVQEHPTRSTATLVRALARTLPLVTTVHDPVAHSGADCAAARPFAESFAEVRAASDRLIVHGERLIAPLADGLADGARRIRGVPHGILRFGSLGPCSGRAAEASDGLIFFGRMNRYKGLDTLLDANDRWLAAGLRPRLIVAGDGPELARWRERMAATGNIQLHPGRLPQEAMRALVEDAAAAVLPYHDATGSGAAASALGAGRPVLATTVGALGEMIRDEHNGLLVAPGDPAALAAAGSRLINNPQLLRRLAAGAQQSAGAEFGWHEIGLRSERVYAELIEGFVPGRAGRAASPPARGCRQSSVAARK